MAESLVESIFFAALNKPAAERAAYLDQACSADLDLRRRVERLLAAHPHAARFLERPADPVALTGDIGNPARTTDHDPAEDVGTTIGPYKLLQQLGEGGMGTVWAAEQEEPVRRRVALKVIKAGLGSAQILRRFDAERQALALMDHSNIARVLDAGATGEGLPYFVMEL